VSNVRFWHLADSLIALSNVRIWENSGHPFPGSLAIFAAIRWASSRARYYAENLLVPVVCSGALGSDLAFLNPFGELLVIFGDPPHDCFRLGFFHFVCKGANFFGTHTPNARAVPQ
jgi:hypothetical protein